jgi:hypothetical protein
MKAHFSPPLPSERFLAQVKALRGRARLGLVVERLVQGTFAGLVAGLLLAALAGTVRLPLAAPLAAAATAALGAAAGALAGLLARVDTRRLLIRVDRALASRELATTAWDFVRPAAGRPGTGNPGATAAPPAGLFAGPILEDAAGLLAGSPGTPARTHARRMLGVRRTPLLPALPVLAALIAAACTFPFDLAKLFERRPAEIPEIAVLGGELESLGRRLESSSLELESGRGLELSRDLAQLGRDLRERTVEPGETLERIESLRRRILEEYGMRLQRYPPGQATERIGEGGGTRESGEGESAETDTRTPADGDPNTADSPQAGKDPASEDLDKAMEKLDDLENWASRRRPGEADPSQLGRGGGAGPGRRGSSDGSPESGEGEGGGGPPGDAEGALSREPGTTPVPDRPGTPSEIARPDAGVPLRAESTAEGVGEALKLLVRSLPSWTAAQIPDRDILRSYQGQAESALAREEVPARLRPYVKRYFAGLAAAGQGR